MNFDSLEPIKDALRRDRLWSWCILCALVGAAIGFWVGRWVLPAFLE